MIIEPVSRDYGISQGGSISRYYIDKYVSKNIENMNMYGKFVMEIGDDRYSRTIDGCQKLIVRNTEQKNSKYIFADLESGIGCKENIADLIVLTNVLSCLYDVKSALENVNRMIKPGGTIIITVPGIAQICQVDYRSYGQFWRFTPMCLERLIEDTFRNCKSSIETYGNVKAAMSFLNGESVNSLSEAELMYLDKDYPVLIGATIQNVNRNNRR